MTKLFGNLKCKKKSCCDSGCDAGYSDCGCSSCGSVAPMAAPYAAPVAAPAMAPATSESMPPAPIVDPSARVSSKRHVIQASARYVR
ncbi:hypothetical protein [Stieleria varia]|uniref:hypothetical protein n=1 Tax=Stieleria varia TaxID=2528005 RepID=UPI0011B594A5|nr:hypothetical protein [Stieleria varia]